MINYDYINGKQKVREIMKSKASLLEKLGFYCFSVALSGAILIAFLHALRLLNN